MARDRSRKRPPGPATTADAGSAPFERDAAAPPTGVADAEDAGPLLAALAGDGSDRLAELVAALVAEHGVEAIHRELRAHAPPLYVVASAVSPEESARIAEALRTVEHVGIRAIPTAPPKLAFAHPLLPGHAFPAPVGHLDAGDIRPLRLERAILDADREGRCTAICRPAPALGGGRVVMAVIAPGGAFESRCAPPG